MVKQHIWSFLQNIVHYKRNLFYYKTHFAWYEISVYFYFLWNILQQIFWKGLIQAKNFIKVSQFSKLNFRFEVWIYLVSNVIQKTHDGFKVNESVCIAEQQYVITIIKIFENKPKLWQLDGKIFCYYMSVYCNTFNDRCTFFKITSYYAPLITPFQ